MGAKFPLVPLLRALMRERNIDGQNYWPRSLVCVTQRVMYSLYGNDVAECDNITPLQLQGKGNRRAMCIF